MKDFKIILTISIFVLLLTSCTSSRSVIKHCKSVPQKLNIENINGTFEGKGLWNEFHENKTTKIDTTNYSNDVQTKIYFDGEKHITASIYDTTDLKAQNNPAKKKLKKEIVTRANVKPAFYGGNEALFDYINKNLKYPKNTKAKGINGQVRVSFIVEKNGRLTNINIERSLTKSHNRKVKKLIRKMPKWKPALINGQPVRFRFHLPVVF